MEHKPNKRIIAKLQLKFAESDAKYIKPSDITVNSLSYLSVRIAVQSKITDSRYASVKVIDRGLKQLIVKHPSEIVIKAIEAKLVPRSTASVSNCLSILLEDLHNPYSEAFEIMNNIILDDPTFKELIFEVEKPKAFTRLWLRSKLCKICRNVNVIVMLLGFWLLITTGDLTAIVPIGISLIGILSYRIWLSKTRYI